MSIDFNEKKNSFSLEAALQNEKFVNSALRIPMIIGKAGAEDLVLGEMIYISIEKTKKIKVPYISEKKSIELARKD